MRFGQAGQVFDNPDEANAHSLFPWVVYPPVAFIERVWANNAAEATAIKHRFGLTDLEVDRNRREFFASIDDSIKAIACAVEVLAEGKIDQLAGEFDGEFVGTGPATEPNGSPVT